MSEIRIAMAVEEVAKIISGAPFPSIVSLSKARRVVDYLESTRTPQWLPIESAPKDGTEVDLWHPKLGRITGSYWDSYMERWTILRESEGPTHFMIPPAAPEVE